MKKDDVLKKLPEFTRAELEEIRAVCDHLLAGRISNVVDDALRPLYAAMQHVTREDVPYHIFLKTASRPHWYKHAPTMLSFIDGTFPEMHNMVMRQAMMRFVLQLIVNNLKGVGVKKPSMGVIVRNLGRVSEVFEQAFPGYIESGLASMITKGLQKG